MTRPPHLGRLDIYCPSYVPFSAEAHLSAHCGGSEEAVIHVAPRLRALGWDVTVWASMGEADAYSRDPRSRLHIKDGVLWQPVEGFDVSADREALLIWRASHALGDAGFQKAPGAKVLWLHDAVLHGNPAAIREHADAVLVLSRAHRAAIEPLMGGDVACAERRAAGEESVYSVGLLSDTNYVQTQNGIAPDEFPLPDESQRVPTRAVYFSSPDRGLETLLDLWPAIRAHVPAATLDVFYGFGSARRMAATEVEHRRWLRESEKRITGRLEALAPSGVTMRGGVSHPELQAFLRTCGVWAYPHGESKVETSCIAAMKALACGVWPVTTDAGALGETCFDGTLLPAASLATDDGKARYVRAAVDALCGVGVRAGNRELDLTPETRASLRTEALRRYDWAIAAKQISDVLRECAAERAAEAA